MYVGAFSRIHPRREIGPLEVRRLRSELREVRFLVDCVDVGAGSHVHAGPPRGPGESLEKDVESKSLIGKFLIKKLSICKFDTTLLSWQLQASKTTTKSRFRPGAEVAVVLADAAQDTAQDTVPLSKALALLRRPLHCPNSERIPNDP